MADAASRSQQLLTAAEAQSRALYAEAEARRAQLTAALVAAERERAAAEVAGPGVAAGGGGKAKVRGASGVQSECTREGRTATSTHHLRHKPPPPADAHTMQVAFRDSPSTHSTGAGWWGGGDSGSSS